LSVKLIFTLKELIWRYNR